MENNHPERLPDPGPEPEPDPEPEPEPEDTTGELLREGEDLPVG